jgi:hypothetical protein
MATGVAEHFPVRGAENSAILGLARAGSRRSPSRNYDDYVLRRLVDALGIL